MDSYLVEYISQRMRERGFDTYHHEPVSVLTSDKVSEYRIQAYNEFYFLVSRELTDGTVIRSDINNYLVNLFYSSQVLHQVQEFTGLIIIENPKNSIQLLEFIRVIPQ